MISENKSGGILLQASHAEIKHSNILNNGDWELKILGNGGKVEARNNWWGNEDLNKIRVIGAAKVEPVLKEPIDFMLSEEMIH